MERPYFASVEAYRPLFTDAAYWRPYVTAICARHGLAPFHNIRAGLPGTHPVFIVDDRYAVKLFTDLFDGAHSFAVETELYSLLTTAPEIPAPSLLAHGRMFSESDGDLSPEGDEWPWPYIVTSVIPGTSLGEVAERVAYADKEALAAYLGHVVRHIYALPVERSRRLPRSWDAFIRLLQERRAACATESRGSVSSRGL